MLILLLPTLAWTTSACACLPGCPVVQEARVAPPSDSLDDALGAAQAMAQLYRLKLDSFRVDFTTKVTNGTIKSLPGLSNVHTFVAVGNQRYFDIKHRDDRFDDVADFSRNRQYYDGVNHFLFQPNKLLLYKRTGREARDRRRDTEFILDAIGLWPATDMSRELTPDGVAYYDYEILSGDCVADGYASFDGHRCLVVSHGGSSRLYLDERVDFQPRSREFLSGRDDQGRPTIRCTFQMDDFKLVAAGTWFPHAIQRRIESIEYANGATVHNLIVGTVARVQRVEVGASIDPLINGNFEPVPGTIVVDGDKGEPRQVNGGLEFLDRVAELAKKRTGELNGTMPTLSRGMPSIPLLAWTAALAVPISATIVLGSRTLISRFRRRYDHAKERWT